MDLRNYFCSLEALKQINGLSSKPLRNEDDKNLCCKIKDNHVSELFCLSSDELITNNGNEYYIIYYQCIYFKIIQKNNDILIYSAKSNHKTLKEILKEHGISFTK